MSQEDAMAVDQPKIKAYAKGAVVCREGVPDGGEMYVLLKGSAGEYMNYDKPSERQLNALSIGSFYGEMSLFLEKKRESTLVTLSDSVFLQIGRDNVNEFLKTETRVVHELIKTLCSSLYAFTGKGEREDAPQEVSGYGFSAENLFPEGHGRYALPKTETPSIMLYEKTYDCPVCEKKFKVTSIRSSKLVQMSMESDLRVKYKDIEPLYYDVVTCPDCYYSALSDSFAGEFTASERASLKSAVEGIKSTLKLDLSNRGNAKTVFATYFIAMRCLPAVMSKPQLSLAKLWMKVSRLYDDCEDAAMSDYAARKAMDLYYHAYMNSDIPPNQASQLEYLLGVLSIRFGDLSGARKLFYQVKINKSASQVLRRLAEDRVDEMKDAKSE